MSLILFLLLIFDRRKSVWAASFYINVRILCNLFQFDLVCDYDVYPTLGLVALNIGGPIGVYTFGLLNDRIGRKKSFFLCLTTLLIGSIMTAYAHEYWFWVLARVIVGLTIPAVYQIPFIICKYYNVYK